MNLSGLMNLCKPVTVLPISSFAAKYRRCANMSFFNSVHLFNKQLSPKYSCFKPKLLETSFSRHFFDISYALSDTVKTK